MNIKEHLKPRKGIRNLDEIDLSDENLNIGQSPIQPQEFEVYEFVELRMSAKKFENEYVDQIQKRLSKELVDFKVEEATENDIERLFRLYENARTSSNAHFRRLDHRDFKKLIAHPLSYFLIAQVNGEDAGFIFIEIDRKNQKHGYITGLGIEPKFKRKGLGSALAAVAFHRYFKDVVDELICEVYYQNEASFRFITSMGFEIFD